MITLKFTDEQMNILQSALVEMPFKVVSPMINDINKQIKEQKEEGKD